MDTAVKKIRKRLFQHTNFGYQLIRSRVAVRETSPEIESLKAFCIFVGYPRSGSTLVASMLGAHPDVVLGHEADVLGHIKWGANASHIYDIIMKESEKFASQGNAWEGYDYEVPNQWQGRNRDLLVLGDKEAGMTSVRLSKNPSLVNRLRKQVQAPLRIIHVVRNPFDNITTMFRRGRYPILRLPLERCIEDFRNMCSAVETLKHEVTDEEFCEIRHEELLQDPASHLQKLCTFLGIDSLDDFIQDCSSIVNPVARKSRDAIEWSDENIQRVQDIIRDFPSHQFYKDELETR